VLDDFADAAKRHFVSSLEAVSTRYCYHYPQDGDLIHFFQRTFIMTRLEAVLLLTAVLRFASSPLAECEAADPPSPAILRNPGFEDGAAGWSVDVYGAKSDVAIDRDVTREGKQSLRIAAADPSDTALGQEIQVKPGRFYQLSGWVRTRNLDPRTARVSATFQVQRPGGKGIIVGGVSHRGDTDWTKESIYFESPSDGRVRIAVFFVGFGKGTGSAWFNDLKLEEVDAAAVALRITREPLFKETLDCNQYGQFVEYLCDLVPSMWAEKLHDGSFEGLTPYKVAYLRETDFKEHPWYPSGATNRAQFTLDKTDPISGSVSKRITATGTTPSTVGIAQDGIAVDPKEPCVFSCYLRQEGVKEPVMVRLRCDGAELATCDFKPGAKWEKFSARLVVAKRETSATLEISFRGPGTLWLDNASLMPEKTIGGWRPDVVEAVKSLKPGIIRFGGSALDDENLGEFDWRDTVGDPDRRRPFRAWGGLQPTGPGLEEVVQFCRHVGAEPLICVRVTKKGATDAAEQVEYFNGAVDTPMGRIRAKNGHAESYRIKFWQIGNERAGADYEARLPEFCKAMKAADAGIQLLSSYPTPGVLEKAGEWLDFVCPHHYSIGDLAGTEADLKNVREMIREHAHGRSIKVAVTEWNTTGGDWGPPRAMLWTLENALACSRYHNLLHRCGDLVTIANRSNLANSFCSGIIQTNNHRLFLTPTAYAQRLYATLAGDRPLKIESTLPVNLSPDVSATLSTKGDALVLFAVNPTQNEIVRPLDLSAFGNGGQEAKVWTLADTQRAGEPDAVNSFDSPNRVIAVESKFQADTAKFTYRFPPLSLTVLRWAVK
jgi:alpha-L-arabinofuranosidase